MTEAVLELLGLRKAFGAHAAVHGLDLVLQRGEFLTFLGPSGSGKTTTLMMVAGLLRPDAGRILLDGNAVDRLPAWKRDIGMVFQHYALFPHMSVARNIAFPLETRGVAKAEITRQVEAALALVGLPGFGQRLPRELSGGQQQRVALARAMVYRPALLLMDEPLGALDRKLREQMQAEIVRVHRHSGTSVLYVTHDQQEALTMSDRIAVFNAGRIEQLDTPEALYETPATRFVASFLGETNFLRGALLSSTGAVRLQGRMMQARAPADAALHAGSAVDVAVRPERLRIQPGGAEGLPAVVTEVTYLGSARRYRLQLTDGSHCQAQLQAGAPEAGRLLPGAVATLNFDAQHAQVFAAD